MCLARYHVDTDIRHTFAAPLGARRRTEMEDSGTNGREAGRRRGSAREAVEQKPKRLGRPPITGTKK